MVTRFMKWLNPSICSSDNIAIFTGHCRKRTGRQDTFRGKGLVEVECFLGLERQTRLILKAEVKEKVASVFSPIKGVNGVTVKVILQVR